MACGGCAQAAAARQAAAGGQAAAHGGATSGEWVYVDNAGNITKHPTQLAARAAKARNGGKGMVQAAP